MNVDEKITLHYKALIKVFRLKNDEFSIKFMKYLKLNVDRKVKLKIRVILITVVFMISLTSYEMRI